MEHWNDKSEGRLRAKNRGLAALLCALGMGFGPYALGQQAVGAPQAAADAGAAYSPEELDDLVGRIALYPDDLIAIILPASTYPLEVVEAARFEAQHDKDPGLKPDGSWDDSIVALLNYPEVLKLMNDDLDWTQKLGDAVANQQADVFDAIQRFRDRALAAGNLKSDEHQLVTRNDGDVEIAPANPEVVYVPYYEPEQVIVQEYAPIYYYPYAYPLYYYPYPAGYSFGTGFFFGVTTAFVIGWHTHYIHVDPCTYIGHPYYGRLYYEPFYVRRSITVNLNLVNLGHGAYSWRPNPRVWHEGGDHRVHYGSGGTPRPYDGRYRGEFAHRAEGGRLYDARRYRAGNSTDEHRTAYVDHGSTERSGASRAGGSYRAGGSSRARGSDHHAAEHGTAGHRAPPATSGLARGFVSGGSLIGGRDGRNNASAAKRPPVGREQPPARTEYRSFAGGGGQTFHPAPRAQLGRSAQDSFHSGARGEAGAPAHVRSAPAYRAGGSARGGASATPSRRASGGTIGGIARGGRSSRPSASNARGGRGSAASASHGSPRGGAHARTAGRASYRSSRR